MWPKDTERGERSSFSVSCDVDAIPTSEVRRLVRAALRGREDGVVEDAVLVADELATNALRHGRGPRRCRVGVTGGGRRLRVEVDDTAPDRPAEVRSPDRFGGRGLILVDQLTASWGVRYHSRYKTVWAELPLPRTASAG
jgi:anti-sigma regulatory factor (Ser/Thr protein kinase)